MNLIRALEDDMRRKAGISLDWYDVMVHLSESPGGLCRMSDLAGSLVLSRSWVTRRIDAMERAGLVHRCPSPDDGRGVHVALTPSGKRLFGRASVAHVRAVERSFTGVLEPAELEQLASAYTRIGRAALAAVADASAATET
jgi:DNA-binding MarR family transcriptional regulator